MHAKFEVHISSHFGAIMHLTPKFYGAARDYGHAPFTLSDIQGLAASATRRLNYEPS